MIKQIISLVNEDFMKVTSQSDIFGLMVELHDDVIKWKHFPR